MRKVGNPTKDYFSNKLHYANFLDKGFDLVFKEGVLVKVILHTNQFRDVNFSFYDRCNFELKTQNGLTITPITAFSQLKLGLVSLCEDINKSYEFLSGSQDCQQKTEVYAFESFLLEVLPES